MKRIINGRKYDTDKSSCVGEYSYSHKGDIIYIHECLYKKSTGEFFLWGESGSQGKFSKTVSQNCWEGGEGIIPITIEEAKEWTEEFDNIEYEGIFGEVEE